jgi:hypothetical protein
LLYWRILAGNGQAIHSELLKLGCRKEKVAFLFESLTDGQRRVRSCMQLFKELGFKEKGIQGEEEKDNKHHINNPPVRTAVRELDRPVAAAPAPHGA